MLIFFATDVHGSDTCFKKFINAAQVYGADCLILGGDMTGKALIPIIHLGGQRYQLTYLDQSLTLEGEDEVRAMEQTISGRGYYSCRVSPDELAELEQDREARTTVYVREARARLDAWTEFAHRKLDGTGIPVYICPGNDDPESVFEGYKDTLISDCEGRAVELADGVTMISTGYSPPTPWETDRELSEEALGAYLEEIGQQVPDPGMAVCNFHCPPYQSGLDEAPELDADMRPVFGGQSFKPAGSTAVRHFLEKYEPLLGLHGHIHEGRGVKKIGRTLVVNPGSAYEQGMLQGALVEIKKGNVTKHALTVG
jgi:uncharacterized protein